MRYKKTKTDVPVRTEVAADAIIDSLRRGYKVLVFGVGGNAANAIHFAAELSGKYEQFEQPLPCICLSENPSIITAIANDFGWEHVFSRQVEALGKAGDTLLIFSISTNGLYLHRAIDEAIRKGCKPILICGKVTTPVSLGATAIELESLDTPWVQEKQLEIIHNICSIVKKEVSG